VMRRALEMCVPSDRCAPAHCWQSTSPLLITAQSGCPAPQSAHRSLPAPAAINARTDSTVCRQSRTHSLRSEMQGRRVSCS
jgi:hypothetical protein